MVFSSLIFLLYFLPIFLFAYKIVGKKLKNIVILLFSILFYSWGAPYFIFVILITTFIDFHLVKWMSASEKRLHRRLILSLSIGINLGLLIYFKYSGFFIENLNFFLNAFHLKTIPWLKLTLPLGISFYTFETITYAVDVYRKIHKPLNKFWDYQLYIILFPKLIAGPIIRYHELADQITDRSQNETYENALTGIYRFILGLAKKVLIANQVGIIADNIFKSDYSGLSSFAAIIGILAYTFQIYFDFSGYSDMAIGLGKLMGFKFPENFNNPYTSQSITEFWRRWHMTLGNWMKNYLYIPLGGNKVSTTRLYLNLWIVFLISGLWHGASWNFIIWGTYHGTFLVLERVFLIKIYNKIGKLMRTLVTFFIVTIGWVFFRVEKFHDALVYIHKIFSFDFKHIYILSNQSYFFFALAIIFSFFTYFKRGETIQNGVYNLQYSNVRHLVAFLIAIILLIISISYISISGFNPFIYFRF